MSGKSSSFLRALCLLWALAFCPLALCLLWTHETGQGLMFAVASLGVGVAPFLITLDSERVVLRGAGYAGLGLWLVLSIVLIWQRPNGQSAPGARVSNHFVP